MNSTKAQVDSLMSSKSFAVLGVSRTGKKMGNYLMKSLKSRGYDVYPIHPAADEVDGVKCVRSFNELKGKVDAALFCIKPVQTELELKNADKIGIKKVWIQQGAESPAALKFCEEKNIETVHSHCMMMFMHDLEWYHRIHRFVWKVAGKMPA